MNKSESKYYHTACLMDEALLALLEKKDYGYITVKEIYIKVFDPILERFRIDECERKYVLAYHISGMHAIIIEWTKGGCKESMPYIAGLLIKYTLPYKDQEDI